MKYILSFIAGSASLLASFYGWNYYEKNIRDADVYQSLGESLSKSILRDAVIDTEKYKLVFGFYPETINELRGNSFHSDPASGKDCEHTTDFYYELLSNGKNYYLFSKGKDCTAFTADDIFPVLTEREKSNIGLKSP